MSQVSRCHLALFRATFTMRGFVVLFVMLSVAFVHATMDDGRPGCQTPAEAGNVYPHFNDPTKFWLCSAVGRRAELRRCPDNRAFSQEQRACVPWLSWQWGPAAEPLSRPADYVSDEAAVEVGQAEPQVVEHQT